MARDEAQKLSGTLGASDRRKVDEYLDSIREIERRIEKAETDGRHITAPLDKPPGIPAVFADHAKLLFDLQFAAFQTDLTRVVSMVIGREGSVRTYDEIGVSDPHHPLSHHRNMPEALEKLTKINTFHVELFAHFIARLKATPDGDGTLLDHSMILYGCGIADSNRHTHEKLPILVMGGANGTIATARHLRPGEGHPRSQPVPGDDEPYRRESRFLRRQHRPPGDLTECPNQPCTTTPSSLCAPPCGAGC